MKTLLVAINSKFIHSGMGVHCIKAYVEDHGESVEIGEYTINNNEDMIVQDIYKRKPDLLGFSCYIWNIDIVMKVVKNINKVLPDTKIFLGGPEVSFDGEKILSDNPEVSVIVLGEGEEKVLKLIRSWKQKEDIAEVEGVIYREGDCISCNAPTSYMDLDSLGFIYEDKLDDFENKIIYYESSRGCPYRCSYCLSSVDKKIRYRSLEKVFNELKIFLDNKIKQVKFVDRTFNCDGERAKNIWRYLKENDNGVTNFHFEISADILDEEAINILKDVRTGYFQFEIGVQTTNTETLSIINRKMDFKKISKNVGMIKANENIHLHLDLIAGLPKEGYESFKKSFNDVYSLKPEELQLGFLKVLKGTEMRDVAKEYGLIYKEEPPYEILYTEHMNFDEILRLKMVEEVLEIYYNTTRFVNSVKYLEGFSSTPFEFYETLAEYWEVKEYNKYNHSEMELYTILYEFGCRGVDNCELLMELLKLDMYTHEKLKKCPEWLTTSLTESKKETIYEFYKNQQNIERYLSKYISYDSKQISRMAHIECFEYDVLAYEEKGEIQRKEIMILFNYKDRDKLTQQAKKYNIV
ncbi:MAG TPA: B12-binding domain-containing radical SAM protein [Clostridiales bacterium]|nr:MAG: hypothetical protein A2Y18_02080 [Clostridiales bacterium GWD2_32_19]HCC07494.1 B12-binding domain-containing radical SAM protein [Clostridiales bacterium]